MIITENKIDNACNRFKKVQLSKKKKFENLDKWLDKESKIFDNEINNSIFKYPKFKRGEIIKADFGVNIGSELSHTHFAIVLNSDDSFYNDNITVIPITSKNGYKRIPLGKILRKAIPNTTKYNLHCYGLLTQIKTISKKRVFDKEIKYICDSNILNLIDKNIKEYLTKYE